MEYRDSMEDSSARMKRIAAMVVLALLAGGFALANRFETVAVHLGFTVLNQVPLAGFFFVAFLGGMVAMLLLSLPEDTRVRRVLREHGLLDDDGALVQPPASRPRTAGGRQPWTPPAVVPADDATLSPAAYQQHDPTA